MPCQGYCQHVPWQRRVARPVRASNAAGCYAVAGAMAVAIPHFVMPFAMPFAMSFAKFHRQLVIASLCRCTPYFVCLLWQVPQYRLADQASAGGGGPDVGAGLNPADAEACLTSCLLLLAALIEKRAYVRGSVFVAVTVSELS